MRMPTSIRRTAAAAFVLPALVATACQRTLPDRDWPAHGGDAGHTQSSPLDQITTANVQRLKVAWTYHTGDARAERSEIQCNPIVVHGVLYATSPQLKVFALDAATGTRRWVFDPFRAGKPTSALGVNRGVVFWESGTDQRIFMAAGQTLYALDAKTGVPITSFGEQGGVSLKEGLGRDGAGLYVLSNTPGAIYKDLLILGTRVSEGPGVSSPGHIRAFDVRTGKMRWIFHTIPWPGEPGYDTWPPDAWQRVGGANAWSGISVDHARGLVFLPTGSAAFDFWGGNRHGANLFANCLLVLDAATGKRRWHHQFVHHDMWDRDLPAAPVLTTVTHGGRRVDAVAQTTKAGYVYLFNRDTGEPLFPIEEHQVPASDLRGEQAWPSQPLPVKPPAFARQAFTESEVTDLSPESHAAVLQRLRMSRTGKPFIPPSTQGTVIFPGFDGGAEWGGAAFDETSGLLYVNSNEMPWILTMVEIDRGKQTSATARGRRVYQTNCIVCHGPQRRGDRTRNVPTLVDVNKRLSRDAVEKVIAGGKGVMPAFPALTPNERTEVVAYLFGDKPTLSSRADPDEPEPEVPYTTTGYNRFFDPDGYPAVKPPWGTLNAIDLNNGEIAWKVPLGELPELVKRGRGKTGTENYGGPIVTSGGLVFIGATKDEKFRAFDKKTGQVLWETSLPAGGYATPSTYAVGGKQYVVIAAGGGKMGTKSGDAFVAFALPD
jgi:quinoprotein glucose dehydrogenase